MCTYFGVFTASPAPTHPSIKDAAFGRLHNSGAGAFGARPTVVDSIMVDGKLANIAINPSPMINLKPIPIPIPRLLMKSHNIRAFYGYGYGF